MILFFLANIKKLRIFALQNKVFSIEYKKYGKMFSIENKFG